MFGCDVGVNVCGSITASIILSTTFFEHTAAEVIGLREIDFRTIGAGEPGPITRHLHQVFHQVVRGQAPRYQ